MRVPRDAKLETREGRRSLAESHDPYWRALGKGLAIGYRKGRWWVRERVDGKYTKRSIGEADDNADADAEKTYSYRDACKIAYEGGDAIEEARFGSYTVAHAIADYLRWFAEHRKSARNTTTSCEKHILPKLGRRPVEALTTREIREWHERIANTKAAARSAPRGPKRFVPEDPNVDDAERKRRRKATANRNLTILKAALSHAFREGFVDNDREWRRVKPFRGVDAPRVRYLSPAEAKRLINACAPDFRALVRGALMTGCRRGELAGLRVEDYNTDSCSVFIRESKGGKQRSVPLTDEGAELFESLIAGRSGNALVFTRKDGAPWGGSHQVRRMQEACETAKLEPAVRFNELRHTYASLLAQAGVPLQVIAELLGHSDTRMTVRHYAHLSPSHVADQVRANLPRLSGKKRAKVKAIR